MFYLMMHSTHFIYGYMVSDMVKDHSDSERGNPLPPHGLLILISSKVLLYASSHRHDDTYHGLCYTSRGSLAGTRNSSMGPPHEGSIRWPIAPWANALTTELNLIMPLMYFPILFKGMTQTLTNKAMYQVYKSITI